MTSSRSRDLPVIVSVFAGVDPLPIVTIHAGNPRKPLNNWIMADVSRDLPIGNGALLVNFDHNYQLRDIYYPRVGQENHTSGEPCRFGIWVDGRFAWLDDPAWSKNLVYQADTLVTNVTVSHPDLLVTITFNDAV